jgi:hypothetical protein
MVAVPPADGAAMVFPSATFASMRSWLNGIPAADVVAGSIQGEHLVRPVLAGFPVQGQTSDWSEVRWHVSGLDGAALYSKYTWSRPDILSMAAKRFDSADKTWRTPIGGSLTGRFSRFRASFSCSAQVRVSPDLWQPAGSLANAPTVVAQVFVAGLDRETGLEFQFGPGRATLCGNKQSSTEFDDSYVVLFEPIELYCAQSFGFSVKLDFLYVCIRDVLSTTLGSITPVIDQIDLAQTQFDVEAW